MESSPISQEVSPVTPSECRPGSPTASPIEGVEGKAQVTNKRKYASTGGGRAWTEQEVSIARHAKAFLYMSLIVSSYVGGLLVAYEIAEDAVQTHCCPAQED